MNNNDFYYSSGGYLDDPDSNVVFYILLKAVDRFYTQYHRYPGTYLSSESKINGDIFLHLHRYFLQSAKDAVIGETSVVHDTVMQWY